jgi:hypothetical protein
MGGKRGIMVVCWAEEVRDQKTEIRDQKSGLSQRRCDTAQVYRDVQAHFAAISADRHWFPSRTLWRHGDRRGLRAGLALRRLRRRMSGVDVRNHHSEIRDQRTEVRDHRSKDRGQRSVVRGQRT